MAKNQQQTTLQEKGDEGYPKELMEALRQFEYVKTVYYNMKSRSWHFVPVDGFEAVSAAEILARGQQA